MKYTYKIEVPYLETDASRHWRLYNMENTLLNVASKVANELGFGVKQLLPYGYTWIISRMDIEMQKIPVHGDSLTVETWIERNAHMLSTRNYRIYMGKDTSGELIGQAASVWAVLDLQTRQVVNAFDLPIFKDCVDGEELNMTRVPRMLPMKEVEAVYTSKVKYSDVDYNGHCNSCKYLENMMNVYRPSFLEKGRAMRLTISYSKEIKEGDTYMVKFIDTDNSCQWQIVTGTGEVSASARLTNEIQR
ncbi:MAG: hypothetical protein K5660_09905 [Paludibacteraceae bacterium]|nr:hypothetical protein [Paludibacteraceae bacterium]